jgi:hypothetical protein
MVGDGPSEVLEHDIIEVLINPNDLDQTAHAIINMSQNQRKKNCIW